jgi:hypothetical protein
VGVDNVVVDVVDDVDDFDDGGGGGGVANDDAENSAVSSS